MTSFELFESQLIQTLEVLLFTMSFSLSGTHHRPTQALRAANLGIWSRTLLAMTVCRQCFGMPWSLHGWLPFFSNPSCPPRLPRFLTSWISARTSARGNTHALDKDGSRTRSQGGSSQAHPCSLKSRRRSSRVVVFVAFSLTIVIYHSFFTTICIHLLLFLFTWARIKCGRGEVCKLSRRSKKHGREKMACKDTKLGCWVLLSKPHEQLTRKRQHIYPPKP